MTPIFFPFTYMSERIAAALSAVFDKTVLYRPSAALLPESLQQQADAGFLDVRIPIPGDEDRLVRAAADYRAWAERHSGSPLAFFKSLQGQVPFFDDASLSKIRSDIKRWTQEREADEPGNPIFAARLFLTVAQAFDREQWEVDRGFAGLRDLEASLLKSIHGEEAAGRPTVAAPPADLGGHMTDRRLWAWSCLYARDPAAGALLVTDSKDIFDAALDPIFDAPTLARFDIDWPTEGADWQRRDDLRHFLEALCLGQTRPSAPPAFPGCHGNRMRLRIFHAEGMGPAEVLSLASGMGTPSDLAEKKGTSPAKTVVLHADLSG